MAVRKNSEVPYSPFFKAPGMELFHFYHSLNQRIRSANQPCFP